MNAYHDEYKAIQAASADWPVWAHYLAMDKDGQWHYHEKEPIIANAAWFSLGKAQLAPPFPLVNWVDSLKGRA